ncbi:MAG: hypothetical protein EOP84_07155 [Verrucomicrobiaceae bacterium]|nr:MAG: hypothetical protein EOP84_07155 [Verrucomicrobiaceae bacterium]
MYEEIELTDPKANSRYGLYGTLPYGVECPLTESLKASGIVRVFAKIELFKDEPPIRTAAKTPEAKWLHANATEDTWAMVASPDWEPRQDGYWEFPTYVMLGRYEEGSAFLKAAREAGW